jgi:hypothetical protein
VDAAAERANELSGGNAITLWNLGRVCGRAGRTAEARQLLEALTARRRLTYVPASAFVFVHGGLGERDKALDWMATGIDERDPTLMTSLWVSPSYDPLNRTRLFRPCCAR